MLALPIVLMLAFAISGCAQSTQNQPGANPNMTTESGQIYVYGNEPFTFLGLRSNQSGDVYCLTGQLEGGLMNLQGHQVTVKGFVDTTVTAMGSNCPENSIKAGKAINVTSYEAG